MVLKLKSRTIVRPLTFTHPLTAGMSQSANVCPLLTDLDS